MTDLNAHQKQSIQYLNRDLDQDSVNAHTISKDNR